MKRGGKRRPADAGAGWKPYGKCRIKKAPHIAAFPILADPVDVKESDQMCETVSQPSIGPDKVDPPMGN